MHNGLPFTGSITKQTETGKKQRLIAKAKRNAYAKGIQEITGNLRFDPKTKTHQEVLPDGTVRQLTINEQLRINTALSPSPRKPVSKARHKRNLSIGSTPNFRSGNIALEKTKGNKKPATMSQAQIDAARGDNSIVVVPDSLTQHEGEDSQLTQDTEIDLNDTQSQSILRSTASTSTPLPGKEPPEKQQQEKRKLSPEEEEERRARDKENRERDSKTRRTLNTQGSDNSIYQTPGQGPKEAKEANMDVSGCELLEESTQDRAASLMFHGQQQVTQDTLVASEETEEEQNTNTHTQTLTEMLNMGKGRDEAFFRQLCQSLDSTVKGVANIQENFLKLTVSQSEWEKKLEQEREERLATDKNDDKKRAAFSKKLNAYEERLKTAEGSSNLALVQLSGKADGDEVRRMRADLQQLEDKQTAFQAKTESNEDSVEKVLDNFNKRLEQLERKRTVTAEESVKLEQLPSKAEIKAYIKEQIAEYKDKKDEEQMEQMIVDKLREQVQQQGPHQDVNADWSEHNTIVCTNYPWKEEDTDETVRSDMEELLQEELEMPELGVTKVMRMTPRKTGEGVVKVQLENPEQLQQVLEKKKMLKDSADEDRAALHFRKMKTKAQLQSDRNFKTILYHTGISKNVMLLESGDVVTRRREENDRREPYRQERPRNRQDEERDRDRRQPRTESNRRRETESSEGEEHRENRADSRPKKRRQRKRKNQQRDQDRAEQDRRLKLQREQEDREEAQREDRRRREEEYRERQTNKTGRYDKQSHRREEERRPEKQHSTHQRQDSRSSNTTKATYSSKAKQHKTQLQQQRRGEEGMEIEELTPFQRLQQTLKAQRQRTPAAVAEW